MPVLHTTMGNLLINSGLPPELVSYDRKLDKKGLADLLREVALKHPEQYVKVSKHLADVGRRVASEFGGNSFGLEHLAKSAAGRKYQAQVRQKVKQILDRDDLTDQQRHELIIRAAGSVQQQQMDETLAESDAEGNPLAAQVISGSRGNKMNLASLRGMGDTLYADHRDEPIPLAIDRSYSEGLSPIQYFAGAYGARRGVLAAKMATQDAGYLSKQLNQINHRLMVVDEDDPSPHPTLRGFPVDTDDADNAGALLAHDVGPYKRNTVLSPKILKHLKALKHERILVRSPAVGGSPDGGVYGRDLGVREYGKLPGRGEEVGLTAAQALSNPLSQAQLGAKHSGGVVGQEKAVGGFEYINQLVQTPKTFKGGAAHSTMDGTVERIEPAPAGGYFVSIGGEKHYVGAGYKLHVKRGDRVEAGDTISEGFPDPSIITEHKGHGEGRRYFIDAFRKAMANADIKVDRRNVELLARGLINHVELTDELNGHVPGDVLPYNTLEHGYEPREGSRAVTPDRAVGSYLERPYLHYTVGTKVRPSVLKELQHFGVKEVEVHHEPPVFKPLMVRGMANLHHDPDWMTRMYGSGLKGSLLDAVHRGGTSDEHGTSFVPGLARAVDFGHTGLVRQPEESAPLPPEGVALADRSESIMPKRKPTDKPTTRTALDIQPPKQTAPKSWGSGLGSIFKLALDEAAQRREATALLQKYAQVGIPAPMPPGHLEHNSQGGLDQGSDTPSQPVGSSTTTPQGLMTRPHGQAGGNPTTARDVSSVAHLPHASFNAMSGTSTTPQSPPAATTPSAPPQPAAPSRAEIQQDPSRAGQAGYGVPQQNNQFTQPGGNGQTYAGFMSGNEDPEMLSHFVSGGGNPEEINSGFGGVFGRMLRMGSLVNTGAVGTLTRGPNAQQPQASQLPRMGSYGFSDVQTGRMPGGFPGLNVHPTSPQAVQGVTGSPAPRTTVPAHPGPAINQPNDGAIYRNGEWQMPLPATTTPPGAGQGPFPGTPQPSRMGPPAPLSPEVLRQRSEALAQETILGRMFPSTNAWQGRRIVGTLNPQTGQPYPPREMRGTPVYGDPDMHLADLMSRLGDSGYLPESLRSQTSDATPTLYNRRTGTYSTAQPGS